MTKLTTCILVIDDDTDHVDLLKSAFTNCVPNIEVLTAADPNSAITYLAEVKRTNGTQPKLILLDLYLPGREDGLYLLSKIKNFSKNLMGIAIPIVVFSNSQLNKDALDCYELGANTYLVKPSSYPEWLTLCQILHRYWFETVTLPKFSY